MGVLVPREFFITSGHATSPVSDLNAFDLALMDANICEQNLVAVSSVIPDGAVVSSSTTPFSGVTKVHSRLESKGKARAVGLVLQPPDAAAIATSAAIAAKTELAARFIAKLPAARPAQAADV